MVYVAKFSNDTDYSIYLSTWIQVMSGLNKYNEIEVEPGKEVTLHSETGEWDLNDYFYDDNISKWHNGGYKRCEYIGKFRIEPCAQGHYSWMDKNAVIFDGNKFSFIKK